MIWNAARELETATQNLTVRHSLAPEPGGPIGNFGIGDVREFISQTLVGRTSLARPLLIRGNQRIDQGLKAKEYEWLKTPPAQHHLHLLQARALGYWLEDAELAVDCWNESRRYLEAWWRNENRPWTRQEIIREGLDDFMAMAVLGGVFEDYKWGHDPFRAGIEMYEHWLGEPKIALGKIMTPRELGYVLCRHYLNFEFDRGDVLAAGRRMLTANLESNWLGNGQTLRATMWLMLVHWYPAFHHGEALPSPVDVLLMAYGDMPNVTRPF